MKKLINLDRYCREIEMIANSLSGGDEALAGEIVSEIFIAILSSSRSRKAMRNSSKRVQESRNRGVDYLRRRERQYSFRGMRHISLEAMEELGFQVDTDGKVYPPERKVFQDSVELGETEN